MDSLTQAVLGGALGGAVLGRRFPRGAILGGALLATLPDLDVLIDYGSAVANFSEHRGFSHSLLVLTPFSLLLAILLSRRWRDVSPARWWAFTALVLLTHPLLDAFTTYGTQLWWPLGEPVALSSVFIIDPLYTLPLLLAVLVALWRPPSRRALALGLTLSSAYLIWSLAAQQWMTQRVRAELAGIGVTPQRLLVQPMPFSTLLWRATALTDDQRLEMVTGVLDHPGSMTLERFPRHRELEAVAAGLPEARRLVWFTGGLLDYQREQEQLVVTDVRLGVPGAHPFRFVLAAFDGDDWRPLPSTRLSDVRIHDGMWSKLWRRTFAIKPVLCLRTLQLGEAPADCLDTAL